MARTDARRGELPAGRQQTSPRAPLTPAHSRPRWVPLPRGGSQPGWAPMTGLAMPWRRGRTGMHPRPAVPRGKANWKAWKISHLLHLKEPLRTAVATGRQKPASAPWLWPGFHWETRKHNVAPFWGAGEGACERKITSDAQSTDASGKQSVCFPINQNKRTLFPAAGESPLSSLPGAWVLGLGPGGQRPWLPEAGDGWQPLGKQTAPWLERTPPLVRGCPVAAWARGHSL